MMTPLARVTCCVVLLSGLACVSCTNGVQPPVAEPPVSQQPGSPGVTKKSAEPSSAVLVAKVADDPANGFTPETFVATRQHRNTDVEKVALLESPLLKEIESNWDKIQELISSTEPVTNGLSSLPLFPDAQTENQLYKKYYQIKLAELSGYQTLTQDPPETRALVQKLLVRFVGDMTSQPRATTEELRQAVLFTGSKDPIVRLHLAVLVSQDPNSTISVRSSAVETLKEISPLLENDKYSRYFIFQANSAIRAMTTAQDANVLAALDMAVVRSFVDWLESVSHQPDQFEVNWERAKAILFGLNIDLKRSVYEMVLSRPAIDPYLVHMVGALYNHSQSWDYRGPGFSDSVTDDGANKFEIHQHRSMQHSMFAWFLQPKLSGPTEMMMDYALANSEMGSSEEWFLRSIALRLDNFSTYSKMEWSLRPRWGGSIESLGTFAKACLQYPRMDTAVPSYGLELLVRIQAEEVPLGESIFQDPSIYVSLVKYAVALEKAVADAPRGTMIPGDHAGNRSALGALFTLAGDLSWAGKIMRPAAIGIHSKYHRRLQLRGDYAVSRAFVETPELVEPLHRIDSMIKQGVTNDSKADDFSPAFADLVLVRKAFGITETANSDLQRNTASGSLTSEAAEKRWGQLYVNHAETALSRLKEFTTGQQVSLTVDQHLHGWDTGGECTAFPPDAVEIESTGPRPIYQLLSLARFEPPYEVEVTLKQVRPENPSPTNPDPSAGGKYKPIAHVGIALGSPDTASYIRSTSGMRQFGVFPLGQTASIWHPIQPGPIGDKEVPTEGDYRIQVKVWENGAYGFYVNGVKVDEGVDPGFKPRRDILFGSALAGNHPAAVLLSKMSIRKLMYRSPPTDEKDYQAVELYARETLHYDSANAAVWLILGRSLAAQRKYLQAVEAFKSVDKYQKHTFVYEKDYLYLRASCHSKIGSFAKALEDYRNLGYMSPAYNKDYLDIISRETARILAIAPDGALRDGKRALKMITDQNVRYNFSWWEDLWILAAANAEVGNFDEAVKRIRESIALAPAENKEFLVSLEKLFQAKKPYRFQAPQEIAE